MITIPIPIMTAMSIRSTMIIIAMSVMIIMRNRICKKDKLIIHNVTSYRNIIE